MSSAVVSTSAAQGRPFLFDAESEPEGCQLPGPRRRASLDRTAEGGCPHTSFQSTIKTQKSTIAVSFGNRQSAIANAIVPASRLEIRPAPEMASSGIADLDALTGGLPRGCLTEICGPASSGRTTVLLAALAAATGRGEYCALLDASDALDPHSVAAAGVELGRFLWVRCNENSPQSHRGTRKKKSKDQIQDTKQSEHRLEQVLRATDLLLESGGFGVIALDLADLPAQAARRIPLTTWFRFRRAVEHKPTMLLAIEQQAIAGSCSSLVLQLGVLSTQYSALSPRGGSGDLPSHARLLTSAEINVELVRSRLERKPARSIAFETKTAWAG